MQFSFSSRRLLALASALALVFVPACGGGGGGGKSGTGTGGTVNQFAQSDLGGDWTGHLTPHDNSNLPWADGENRILSRNFYARSDANGNFTFFDDGSNMPFDVSLPETISTVSKISRKGNFSLLFRQKEGARAEMALAGNINEARNIIEGEYEFRIRTDGVAGSDPEAVDAGSFIMTLSSGPAHFTQSMFEGTWTGVGYDYAPQYANFEVQIDANGSVIGGGLQNPGGAARPFDTTGSNTAVFSAFEDSSVGRFGSAMLKYQSGRDFNILYLIMDESGQFLTGPVRDGNGAINYARLIKQ